WTLALAAVAGAVGAAAALSAIGTAPAALSLLMLTRSVPLSAEPGMTAGVSAKAAGLPLAFWPVTYSIPVHLASAPRARLAYRELGLLALGHVAFGSRQRGAYQRPVHRPFVVERGLDIGRGTRTRARRNRLDRIRDDGKRSDVADGLFDDGGNGRFGGGRGRN